MGTVVHPDDLLTTETTVLVLTRKERETILVQLPDGRVGCVSAESQGRGQFRVRLDFPSDVRIYRSEIAPEEVLAEAERTMGR